MDKNIVELITCNNGDWEVLKLNGKVFGEGHNISNNTWLELLNVFNVESNEVSISDEEMEFGQY